VQVAQQRLWSTLLELVPEVVAELDLARLGERARPREQHGIELLEGRQIATALAFSVR